MSVASINGSGSQFLSLASDNIHEGAFTSVSGELAVLLLNTEEQQKQTEHQQLESARNDYTEALGREVDALKAEADAAFRGACFSAGTAVLSGGFGVAAAETRRDRSWQGAVSQGLHDLSGPIGGLVGKTYGAADAKSAQGDEEAAKWRIDDAHDALKNADGVQTKALDWVSSMSDRDAATTSAILANKV